VGVTIQKAARPITLAKSKAEYLSTIQLKDSDRMIKRMQTKATVVLVLDLCIILVLFIN
jgi:hypothetical protein